MLGAYEKRGSLAAIFVATSTLPARDAEDPVLRRGAGHFGLITGDRSGSG
jgi:hypothetical protein